MIGQKDQNVDNSPMVACPSCGHEIDVELIIERKTEQRLRREYNYKFVQLRKKLDEDQEQLNRERQEVKRLSSQSWEIIQEELKKERIRLAEQLKTEARHSMEIEFQQLQKELQTQQQANLALQQKEVKLLAMRQKLERDKESMQLQFEKQLLSKSRAAELEFKKQFQQQQNFTRLEYEKKLEDQRRLIEEMTLKMEQGSMQMQGEVQELAMENYLRDTFRLDEVDSIKTGVRGADCILSVNTTGGQKAGKIYFESKRTKHWQNSWIEKLKADMRELKVDLGIIVTQAMPADMEHMGERSGVWVCTFEEMKMLVPILRQSIINVHLASQHSENQSSKMALLYNFLMSSEFRMQMEGIVEGFTQMQEELQKEKRAMQNIWKRREKQIEKVLLNTNHMYGSIKGIAGSEIQSIEALEMGDE